MAIPAGTQPRGTQVTTAASSGDEDSSISNAAPLATSVVQSSAAASGLVNPAALTSTLSWMSAYLLKTASTLSGSKVLGVKTPGAGPSKSANHGSKEVTDSASNTVQHVMLDASSIVPVVEAISSFPQAVLSAVSNRAADASTNVASNAVLATAQDILPNGLSTAVPTAVSNSALAAQSSLPQPALSAFSSIAPYTSSNQTSNPVQSAAVQNLLAQSAWNKVSATVANAHVNGMSDAIQAAIQTLSSNGTSNTAQPAASIAVPGAQSSLSNAALDPVSVATPNSASTPAVLSRVESTAVQTAAPISNSATQNVLPNGGLVSTSVATPNASSTPIASSKAISTAVQIPSPVVIPVQLQESQPTFVSGTVPGITSIASPKGLPNTIQTTVTNVPPDVPSKAVPTAASNSADGVQNSLAQTAVSALPGTIIAPSSTPNTFSTLVSKTMQAATPVSAPATQGSRSDPVLSPAAVATPNDSANGQSIAAPTAPAIAASNATPEQLPKVTADAGQSAASSAVPSGHANGDVDPASGQLASDQASTQPVLSDQSAAGSSLFVPGAAAEQLDALTQLRDGWLVSVQPGGLSAQSNLAAKPSAVPAANGKGASKDVTGDAATTGSASLSQRAQSTALQADTQTGSQQSTTSGDQGQDRSSSQGQNISNAQASFATHAVVASAHAANTNVDTPVQTTPAQANTAGHSAMGLASSAPASGPAPQSAPVINTARLIQNMGQSEMRVGMRSSEFGSISISTSAVRDGVSAQISLDHGELAKALAAHLPEMQARLGGNQSVDVRIDMNGQKMGQGTGTSGGGSNGSNDGGSGARRQAANTGSTQSGNGFGESRFSAAAASTTAGDSRFNTRLDIRV